METLNGLGLKKFESRKLTATLLSSYRDEQHYYWSAVFTVYLPCWQKLPYTYKKHSDRGNRMFLSLITLKWRPSASAAQRQRDITRTPAPTENQSRGEKGITKESHAVACSGWLMNSLYLKRSTKYRLRNYKQYRALTNINSLLFATRTLRIISQKFPSISHNKLYKLQQRFLTLIKITFTNNFEINLSSFLQLATYIKHVFKVRRTVLKSICLLQWWINNNFFWGWEIPKSF